MAAIEKARATSRTPVALYTPYAIGFPSKITDPLPPRLGRCRRAFTPHGATVVHIRLGAIQNTPQWSAAASSARRGAAENDAGLRDEGPSAGRAIDAQDLASLREAVQGRAEPGEPEHGDEPHRADHTRL